MKQRRYILIALAFWGMYSFSESRYLAAEILKYAKLPLRELEVQQNVKFCEFGGAELFLDFVRLKRKAYKDMGAVIFVHGDLISGDRKGEALALAKAAAARGYLGVTIDYRLSGDMRSDNNPDNDRLQVGARFPAPVLDVRCAIRWVRAQHEALGLHPGKIVVGGVGTGGYLALMAGLSGEGKKMPNVGDLSAEARRATNDVRAVLNLGGATDTTAQYWFERTKRFRGTRQIASLVGDSPAGNQRLYTVSSPISFINDKSAPVFTFHGTADYVFPYDAAITLDEEMKKKGVPHTLMTLPAVGYEFKGRDGKVNSRALKQVLDRAFQFLEVSMRYDPASIIAKRQEELQKELKKEQPKDDDWW
ncbi:MAG: alpha/beta hydrolase [Bdellovibrionales bacterium]|nr:alpha/beta hydrolase [Bdellovibrionales bacterium]